MLKIFENDTLMIQKSELCQSKRNSVLFLIQLVFVGIPLEIYVSCHTLNNTVIFAICKYNNMGIYTY